MAFQDQYDELIAKDKANSATGKSKFELDPYMNRMHDYYNCIMLPIVSATNLWHLYHCSIAPSDANPVTSFALPTCSNHVSWDAVWYTFLAYITIDTLWISLFPRSVASAPMILGHHVLCIIGWCLGTHMVWNKWECAVSSSIILETNTMFLIAKRQFKTPEEKRSFLSRLFVLMDHITWVPLRCILWPFIWFNGIYYFLKLAKEYPDSPFGGYLNTGLYASLSGSALLAQNFQWTYDKYLKPKKKEDAKPFVVNDRLNQLHDYYNIVFLPFVVGTWAYHQYSCYSAVRDVDAYTYDMLTFTRKSGNISWDYCFWTFLVYIYVDTLWLLLYPETVASPKAIIMHHIFCCSGWLVCLVWPEYEWYISAAINVELNTFFLIAKRQFRGVKILALLDNMTWFLCRLVMFPIVTANFVGLYFHMSIKLFPDGPMGGYLNTGLYVMIASVIVLGQNMYWTYNKFFRYMTHSSDKLKGL